MTDGFGNQLDPGDVVLCVFKNGLHKGIVKQTSSVRDLDYYGAIKAYDKVLVKIGNRSSYIKPNKIHKIKV